MKRFMGFLLVTVAAGCGGLDLPPFDSLFSRQPRVVSVEPTDGARVAPNAIVAVEFSQPIDPASVDASTLAIVKEGEGASAADLVAALVEGEAAGQDGLYEFAGEGRVAVFRSREPYEAGATYRVIATGGIRSVEMLPLARNPGKTEEAFVSAFAIEGGSTSGDGNGGGAGEAPDGAAGEAADSGVRRPASLIIDELLYDVPGDDTNGVLFVELLGDAGADIGGYRVVFINGDDGATTEEVKIPTGTLIPDDGIFLIADARTGQGGVSTVSGADLIDNFDPQNGPDCVQLLDDKGKLLDALGYGTPISSPAKNGLDCFEETPIQKAPSGSSVTRENGIDSGNNASDFHNSPTPTPGSM